MAFCLWKNTGNVDDAGLAKFERKHLEADTNNWDKINTETAGPGFILLHEGAWELSARGADARFFPWGNEIDPSDH